MFWEPKNQKRLNYLISPTAVGLYKRFKPQEFGHYYEEYTKKLTKNCELYASKLIDSSPNSCKKNSGYRHAPSAESFIRNLVKLLKM